MAIAALGIASCVDAQSIQIGENVRVTREFARQPLVEPHLAADPRDPSHLVAAAIAGWTSRTGLATCASFVSRDGGITWKSHDLNIRECTDPWVAIAPDGHVALVALGKHDAVADPNHMGLLFLRSSDGGDTWQPPTSLGAAHDHPTIAIDGSSPSRAGWLYVVSRQDRVIDDRPRATVFVARSKDGGETFDAPINVAPSSLSINAEVPVVLSNGVLIAPFVDFRWNVAHQRRYHGLLDRSREWMLRSTDGGRSFSPPLFASEMCAEGWSSMAAAPGSGPYPDRLYLACRQRATTSIALNTSDDMAESWTVPSGIHAESSPGAVTRRDNPAIAVNGSGIVAVAWIDSYPAGASSCNQVRFTASLDGGRTFLPDQRVSTADSCPNQAANGFASSRWPRGGDYFGIAAAPDGGFHLLWSDAREEVFQLWTASIRVRAADAR
jgi:BNR/Asp-box repeat